MGSLRPFEVELSLPVRTYDTDFAGVVSNIVYIRWLEDLRSTVLETYFPLSDLLQQRASPVVLRTCIDYKRPVRLFDSVVGRMWVPRIGKLKWYVSAELWVGSVLVVSAEQTGCFLHLSDWQPLPLPAEFVRLFSSWSAARSKPTQC